MQNHIMSFHTDNERYFDSRPMRWPHPYWHAWGGLQRTTSTRHTVGAAAPAPFVGAGVAAADLGAAGAEVAATDTVEGKF